MKSSDQKAHIFDRINIEITNICNLQCSFCPEVVREKKIMKVELFQKIISQVAPITREVCFHLMGEPLGHSHLDQFIQICSLYNVPVNLTSNGILLNDRKQNLLLNPIVRQVNFSLHSFEANFSHKDIGPYLDKIFRFTALAFESRPDLFINYRLWNLDRSHAQTPKNLEILSRIGERFGVNLDLDRMAHSRNRKSKKIVNRLYLHFDTQFDWPSLSSPVRGDRGFCHGLSGHFGIHADGTVVPCCLDKEAVIRLGDLNVQSIEDVLEGVRAQAMRRGFKERRLVEELCKKCSYISRFDKEAKLYKLAP